MKALPKKNSKQECPLCLSDKTALFHEVKERSYFRCPTCTLIFLDPTLHLDPETEKARYDEHRNSPSDPDYRAFLAPLVDAVANHLNPGAQGLDFGSGPGPTISVMMEERGHQVEDYDPFYRSDRETLSHTYDFITCSETIEHIFHPAKELTTIQTLLKPNGIFGIMTTFFDDPNRFAGSHYHRDPTHVCFYSREVFTWIGKRFGWKRTFPATNIAIFQKTTSDSLDCG